MALVVLAGAGDRRRYVETEGVITDENGSAGSDTRMPVNTATSRMELRE